LLDKFFKSNVKLFCLHDLDIDGFKIYETLKNETNTMKGHNIDVIDLGFNSKDIENLDITPETKNYEKPQLKKLRGTLDSKNISIDTYNFLRENKRVELNAVSNLELVEFTENKLKELGYSQKVIPDENEFKNYHDNTIDNLIMDIAKTRALEILEPTLKEIIDLERSKLKQKDINLDEIHKNIGVVLKDNPPDNWKSIFDNKIMSILEKSKI